MSALRRFVLPPVVVNSVCLALILFQMSLVRMVKANDDTATATLATMALVGNRNIGVTAIDLGTGKTVVDHRSDFHVKPASVLKVLTSYAALKLLKPEFNFTTDVYIGVHQRSDPSMAEVLAIKGGGDPSLTTEGLWLLARKIKKLGIREIGKVVLDTTLFDEVKERGSTRAFDAPTSALSLNFNSVSIEACGLKGATQAAVTTDPWEGGIIAEGAVSLSNGKGRSPLTIIEHSSSMVTVSGKLPTGMTCISSYRSVEDPIRYIGMTLLSFLRDLGMKVPKEVALGKVPPHAELAFQHSSRPLYEIITGLNQFSNNFTAAQIVMALGRDPSGTRWEKERGLNAIQDFAYSLGVKRDTIELHDGSGLSHENQVSPRAIVTVLYKAALDPEVGIDFLHSLSVSGRRGTLKERTFPNGVQVTGKTGSLNGVISLAGYLSTKRGRRVAFSIIDNAPRSTEEGLDLQEKILEEMHSKL